MTRRHTLARFVAVLAGAYAALMLIVDRLIEFSVAAGIFAASSGAAALFAYNRRTDDERLTLTRGIHDDSDAD